MSSLAQELIGDVLRDPYFVSLYAKAERLEADKLFSGDLKLLDRQEFLDLMRYADILSHAEDPSAKNKAYKIVSFLSEEGNLKDLFRPYSEAVLAKLGNFPALTYLSDNFVGQVSLPIEREIEVDIKKKVQKTNVEGLTFTDAQYQIRTSLSQYDFFSFSGPTSIGKTFIMKDFIQTLVEDDDINGSCIVLLVPTRALIGQITRELKELITDKTVNISAFPVSSSYLSQRYRSTIYVFTPERLLSHVANNNENIKYLFVDEAQKIVSMNDSRSSLYYHAIYETIARFAAKIIFASPNIPNPEILLRIFEKDQRGTLAISEQTVAQNRYFVDTVDSEITYYSDVLSPSEVSLPGLKVSDTFTDLLTEIGSDTKNLVYCNGLSETVQRALEFSKDQPDITEDKKLKELISYLESYVHKDYYLIQCLRKGVAFHHGRMPQQVRRKVEEYYGERGSDLRYLFCTSTLLEGVNLPAKNIFILNDYHGTHPFDKINFENLIGRAGRLTKEFSGNIICVRDQPTRWKKENELLTRGTLPYAESFLVEASKSKTKEFKNIAKAIDDKPVSKSLRKGESENIHHYASIMLLHHLGNQGSTLKVGFLEKQTDARRILDDAKKANLVPLDILRISSLIKPSYQNRTLKYIANLGEDIVLPAIDESTDYLLVLERLYDLYNWGVEESAPKDALVPSGLAKKGYGKAHLKYWAMLMRHWINGEPLNLLIGYSIAYHHKKGDIWFRENGRMVGEPFTGSQKHVNVIIEQIMNDIENGLRFRIEKYLLNYYLLCKFQLGEANAGYNWADLVEYGTTDKKSVELQNLGLSRGAAKYLLEKHAPFFIFDDDDSLSDIKQDRLVKNLRKEDEYFEEIVEALRLG